MAGHPNYEVQPIAINFHRGPSYKKGSRHLLLNALAFIICTVFVLLFIWQAADVMHDFREKGRELEAVNRQMADLQSLAHPLNNPVIGKLLDERTQLQQDNPDVVKLLNALMGLLPEETSLSGISLQGRTSLRFTALFAGTDQASSFIRAVQASHTFTLAEIGPFEKVGASAPNGLSSETEIILPLRANVELAVSTAEKEAGGK